MILDIDTNKGSFSVNPKVKIFTDRDYRKLEEKINEWLIENDFYSIEMKYISVPKTKVELTSEYSVLVLYSERKH